ncbi:hypothetical protein SporoP37_03090 [Sporosarcina sp. P37]|uniref:baeRF3 domain-containing protein n=1 Tax=unclassified Sporosarcina TaxID=2647733 RepID=UPI0009C0AD7D|nr:MULTISPECIES: hypothetical protein [unclassified Sporosarcina]ARD47214.1 hypothetical protein SporoP33_02420 [Sporosarcina sp. P33]ARK23782.1 hypothetical protein SporoP37_03090 [Sporosarcina sp. P37]PID18929.1 hypothetical protein CSV62_06075 [Sporosarcina sp. P35]
MNVEIVNEFPHDFLMEQAEICISIYQPTHRYRPENQQDPIRFKNLLQKAQEKLSEKLSAAEMKNLLTPLEKLQSERPFWAHAGDGLALFATKDRIIVYRLQRSVPELVIVSDSFHIKPLIRVFQSADRYHLLGVNRQKFKLFEGNRYGVEEVEIPEELAKTKAEAIGDQVTESYLGTGNSGGAAGTAMMHGHGAKKDEIDIDIERYFRYVDRTIAENYSKPTGLPLYLVTLAEYQTQFKELSHNPHLQDKGITSDFEALTLEQLREMAWQCIEPVYLQKTKDLVENFENAKASDQGSEKIEEIVQAASEDRIKRLVLEDGYLYPGTINLDTGAIQAENLEDAAVDDVLDDLAEAVFKTGGEVVVLPKERMPVETGAAAIFRW